MVARPELPLGLPAVARAKSNGGAPNLRYLDCLL